MPELTVCGLMSTLRSQVTVSPGAIVLVMLTPAPHGMVMLPARVVVAAVVGARVVVVVVLGVVAGGGAIGPLPAHTNAMSTALASPCMHASLSHLAQPAQVLLTRTHQKYSQQQVMGI